MRKKEKHLSVDQTILLNNELRRRKRKHSICLEIVLVCLIWLPAPTVVVVVGNQKNVDNWINARIKCKIAAAIQRILRITFFVYPLKNAIYDPAPLSPVSSTIKTDIVLCFTTFRPLTRIAFTLRRKKKKKSKILYVCLKWMGGFVILLFHLAIFRNTLQTVTRNIHTRNINQFDCPLTALIVRSCIFPAIGGAAIKNVSRGVRTYINYHFLFLFGNYYLFS